MSGIQINRNMRCIEMQIALQKVVDSAQINRNMRCIEILPGLRGFRHGSMINGNMRCIEMAIQDGAIEDLGKD